jgi:glycerol-3-phosphate dehydrogenase (NAD(P)+)
VDKITIIGGGSWGTALALALTRGHTAHQVCLWARESDLVQRMRTSRENDVFLPGFPLPDEVEITDNLVQAARDATMLLSVVPSQFLRSVWTQLRQSLGADTTIVSATKGLEKSSLARPSEVITQVLGGTRGERLAPHLSASAGYTPAGRSHEQKGAGLAVLSGPSFAREVAANLPTAVVIASSNVELGHRLQAALAGPALRLYTNTDVTGVEIGAATKNIIAIAAGVCDGLELGTNARASLITRGLVEISRLAVACGGRPETLAGLAGMGDLVLTCTGPLSRNRTVGLELARGRALDEIVGSMRMVAEGVETTRVTRDLARKLSVEMPITEQMHRMLFEGQDPRSAVRELMDRELRPE